MHREANVSDDPLAEPGYEGETDRSGKRQHRDQHQQIFEPARDIAAAGRPEAAIDDQLEGVGDPGRRRGRKNQCEHRGSDPPWIADGVAPDHVEIR